VRIRLEGATRAELDAAEEAARRVFDVGSVSPDYENREHRRGRRGRGTRPSVPGWRRYLEDVTVRVADTRPPSLFGYEQGSGAVPTPGQLRAAHEFLATAEASGEPVPTVAIAIAEEIVAAAGLVDCSMAPEPSWLGPGAADLVRPIPLSQVRMMPGAVRLRGALWTEEVPPAYAERVLGGHVREDVDEMGVTGGGDHPVVEHDDEAAVLDAGSGDGAGGAAGEGGGPVD
jgi:hypothetical protein